MEEMNFDPITGKPLKNQEIARQDEEILFDPMTGKPVGKPKDPEKPYTAGTGEAEKPRKEPVKGAIYGQLRRYIPAAVAALAALIILIFLFRLLTGGGSASSVPPLLFYQTEEGVLMAAKTSGGAPERLLNAEDDAKGLRPETFSPDARYLYLLGTGEAQGRLYCLELQDREKKLTEVGEDVRYAFAADGAVYSYTSAGALYRADPQGKKERILRGIEGFLLSADQKTLVYWDQERVYRQDAAMETDRIRLMPRWDHLYYYAPDFSGFVYGQGGRLYIWAAGKNEETISSQLKDCFCVAKESDGIRVIFTEYAGKDSRETSLYLYEEKGDRVTPILENELISSVKAPENNAFFSPLPWGGSPWPEASVGTLKYTFDVYHERLNESTHYYGEGQVYGQILDEDTVIERVCADRTDGSVCALVYDTDKGLEASGRIVRLSLEKDGASASQLFEASEILWADGGRLWYYAERNGRTDLYLGDTLLRENAMPGEAVYLGEGKLVFLAGSAEGPGKDICYLKGGSTEPLCLDTGATELLRCRFSSGR